MLPDSTGVVSMLRRRVCDEKVNVRKAAVQALESIILLDTTNFFEQVRWMLTKLRILVQFRARSVIGIMAFIEKTDVSKSGNSSKGRKNSHQQCGKISHQQYIP